MQEQKPVRYYIVKSDDKPVVRSVPVARPHAPTPMPNPSPAPRDTAPRDAQPATAGDLRAAVSARVKEPS